MKTDRELLELAAKAAGVEVRRVDTEYEHCFKIPYSNPGISGWTEWNPLTDDGDALRLAVRLGIQIWRRPSGVEGVHKGSVLTNPQTEVLTPDPYAATRRAIVRAAAAIGESMP